MALEKKASTKADGKAKAEGKGKKAPAEKVAAKESAPKKAAKKAAAKKDAPRKAAKAKKAPAEKAVPKAPVAPPVVRASARYVRIAPRKARLIADQVRGLHIAMRCVSPRSPWTRARR